jgi:hypothetical protein
LGGPTLSTSMRVSRPIIGHQCLWHDKHEIRHMLPRKYEAFRPSKNGGAPGPGRVSERVQRPIERAIIPSPVREHLRCWCHQSLVGSREPGPVLVPDYSQCLQHSFACTPSKSLSLLLTKMSVAEPAVEPNQVSELPKGYTTIRDILDNRFKQGQLISVIGIVKDCQLPIPTAGSGN